MKAAKRILWGIVLVLFGVLWILNICGVIHFSLFFDGWWTLFIIVPSLIGLITDRHKLGNIFGLFIGISLLLICNGILALELFWKLLVPAIVILIGCRLIFGNLFAVKKEKARRKAQEKMYEKMHKNGEEMKEYCATFSELNLNFDGQNFYGASLTAVFGSVNCDLRQAQIEDDAVITVCAIFGGVDILLPEDTKVNVTVTSIFGGVSDDRREKALQSDPTLHVGGYCIFGGADIK